MVHDYEVEILRLAEFDGAYDRCEAQISAKQLALAHIRPTEAAQERYFPRLRTEYAEWMSPVTNRLLFEAVGVHVFERWGNNHPQHDDTLRHLGVRDAAVIPLEALRRAPRFWLVNSVHEWRVAEWASEP